MPTPLRRVILLGAPGVGKGTYARRLAPLFGLTHVVVGDLVRAQIRAGTELGRAIAETTHRGDLVDDDVILRLLTEHLRAAGLDGPEGGFMLDGVPRTLGQARAVDALLRPTLALHLTMDEGVMLHKMAARRLGRDERVYNVAYIRRGGWDMPPLLPEPTVWDADTSTLRCAHGVALAPNEHVGCARCTAGLRTREDDTVDVCRHRLATYATETRPLVQQYAPIRLDFEIDGGVEQCLPRLLALLRARDAEPRGGAPAAPGARL
ncbi:hypothetical protein KFE25_007302 [Diacronema lutheri]|uniref:Adenylate kinase n=1 Tax=Diacronema lutheri TaxID=2081491 RepID=A0A8J5XZH7_DIALT|nr:hypothetical protein KFE25_007302 [Diacronema lutheri]